jgi:hypothetical protein
LLTLDELKNWVHRDLTPTDRAMIVLASLNRPAQVAEIKSQGRACGLRAIDKWNVSQLLGRTKGLAISTPAGWEMSDAGEQHLRLPGVAKVRPAAVQVATDLRALLNKINDSDTRAFVEEAVACFELELYRAAVVMSWLAAVDVLKKEVLQSHLSAFNAKRGALTQNGRMHGQPTIWD